jgi:hypothetical protein
MSMVKDGGTAFPGVYGPASEYNCGMTLRDYFAAAMLPRIGMGWPNEENRQVLARQAYQMADAMIAAREGGAA